MDPREQACQYFERTIVPYFFDHPDTDWAARADSADERRSLALLVSVGVMEEIGYGSFALSDEGAELCARGANIREVFGLVQATPAIAQQFTIGSVGAMNTAPGGNAVGTIHGNINVGQVDQALHKLVELQDELGDQAETLWKLLRRVRALELREEAAAANLEELEIRAFLKDLRPDTREHALKILGMVPDLLKIAVAVWG